METEERERGKDGGKTNFIIIMVFHLSKIEYNIILLYVYISSFINIY